MTIRFTQNRRLYISNGESPSAVFARGDNVAVNEIVVSAHSDNQVDIYFANGTIAFGCLPEWYVIVEGGVVANPLAYKSKMDTLPLP